MLLTACTLQGRRPQASSAPPAPPPSPAAPPEPSVSALRRFVAPDPVAPTIALPTWPVTQLPSSPLLQSEALAPTGIGCSYHSVGEGVGEVWGVACERGRDVTDGGAVAGRPGHR